MDRWLQYIYTQKLTEKDAAWAAKMAATCTCLQLLSEHRKKTSAPEMDDKKGDNKGVGYGLHCHNPWGSIAQAYPGQEYNQVMKSSVKMMHGKGYRDGNLGHVHE